MGVVKRDYARVGPSDDPGLSQNHRKAIRVALGLLEQVGNSDMTAKALRDILAGLAITREEARMALSGPVDRRAPGSTLVVFAPPIGRA